eukprot:7749882-Pyramimonas_sp.AAC.1
MGPRAGIGDSEERDAHPRSSRWEIAGGRADDTAERRIQNAELPLAHPDGHEMSEGIPAWLSTHQLRARLGDGANRATTLLEAAASDLHVATRGPNARRTDERREARRTAATPAESDASS